jgi:large conductance mechanosensitive channel
MGFMKEFKEFAVRGSAMDMAVGIVIGAAFGKIVSSLVSDVIMPVTSVLTGNIDFTNKFLVLGLGLGGPAPQFKTLAEAKAAGVVVLSYGVFINAIVDFVIVAFAIFIMMKGINRLKRLEEASKAVTVPQPPPEEPHEVKLLTEIRDLLKK